MTKKKIPLSPELLEEWLALYVEVVKFHLSIHDLEDAGIATMMILSVVYVNDADGHPVTAAEIAFATDLPRRTVNGKLKRLMKAGVIGQDGDRYRYAAQRPFTPDEERRLEELKTAFDKLRCTLPEELNSR